MTVASAEYRDDLDTQARWLEQTSQQLQREFDLPSAPVMVRLFADQRGYQRYGRSHIVGFSPNMDFVTHRASGLFTAIGCVIQNYGRVCGMNYCMRCATVLFRCQFIWKKASLN